MRAQFPGHHRGDFVRYVAGLAVVAGWLGYARGQGVVIFTEDKLPRWNQHHDFRDVYDGRATDIRNAADTAWVPYNQLAGDGRVFWHQNAAGQVQPYFSANPPAAIRGPAFAAGHYFRAGPPTGGLAGGDFHCVPTSMGMFMDWARQTKLTRLTNLGGEGAAIRHFAQAMDTNDENFNLRVDTRVHIGTFAPDSSAAVNQYISDSSVLYQVFGPRMRWVPFNSDGYVNLINRGYATPLWFTGAANMGHVVVGYGYDLAAQQAFYADPWDAANKTIGFAQIQPVPGPVGGPPPDVPFGANGDSPPILPPAAENVPWQNTAMQLLEIPDYQDTPSTFSPLATPAAHLSTFQEWLGSGVSSEISFLDALDDEDRRANVDNRDRYDDGVTLFRDTYRPGMNGMADVSISTAMLTDGLRYDPSDPGTWLNLNAWFDWNNDGLFGQDEQVIDWSGGPGIGDWAAGQALQTLHFSFLVPDGATRAFWARFRLDRGEDIGAYGFAEFGEVEDYRIPAPGAATLALIGLSAVIGLRRRLARTPQ